LCPHLRIYPITKLATPLGIIPFSLWLLIFFCVHFLWFHFSLVLSISESSGYPNRPSGSRGLFQFCFIFQNFDYVQVFSNCTSLQPVRIGRVHTLPLGFSARFSHPAQGSPARISDSRTVYYCLPVNPFVQIFGFEFWLF
jgi:hypothetical protein